MGSKRLCLFVTLAGTALASASGQKTQSFALKDGAGLEPHNVKFEPATYQGREALRITTLSQQDMAGFAVLTGSDIQDGTIEVDVAVKILTPPEVRMPGFTGGSTFCCTTKCRCGPRV